MPASIDAVLRRRRGQRRGAPRRRAWPPTTTGVIYEGAAGPRAVGAAEPVSADSIFRIASMTKMVCTVAALQQRDRGNLDFDAPVDTYCPDFAAVQVLDGFDGDQAETAAAGEPGHRQAARHPHRRPGLRVLERRPRPVGRRRPRPATSSPPRWWPTRAPGSSTASAPTGWAGWWRRPAGSRWTTTWPSTSSPRWGCDSTAFRLRRRAAGPVRARARQGRARRLGRHRLRLGPAPGLVVRRARPVLHAPRLPAVPADAARRRDAGGHDDPRPVIGAGGVHQPDRRPLVPGRDPHRRPGVRAATSWPARA